MSESEAAASVAAIKSEDVLRDLGFREDIGVLSDCSPGLSFDFGDFKLEASHNVNRWLRPAITLGGVMSTERTIAVVHFEMPLEVESFEQGVAFVVHCLDSHAAGGTFTPATPVAWLAEGREHSHLLPWKKRSA